MKNKNIKLINGTVVSDKMDKTITVLVETKKAHPIYKKRSKVSKKYKVHDENNQAKIGDFVSIARTRPISKYKKFRFVKIISNTEVK